ncbi:phosphoglycerate kinase [Pseudodesulfovibrio tunisiensis]|uniref:phosphoglycerate kinase n=1 Tax=Pseudodesulfovibrio tunisiensis TaxID=463192 RepID=UPI001FB43071|nr:phosphoglycerate kinase [Pseudodesulfovibrio tunisiensis]
MQFIDQLDITNKKLLFRVDFNVPLDGKTITDDNRIRAALPTLQYALDRNAAVIVCAHLGKPKGEVHPELSLAPVAARLAELLECNVDLAPDCVGNEVERMAAELKPGRILMLENLRFHKEEQGKTPEDRGDFGARLASLADIYVNDAFGVAHRANASVVDIPAHSPICCAGFLLKKEWEYLGKALKNPARPYVAISGGAKVSTKLGILHNLLGKVDDIIIGGAMANTFMLAKGYEVGRSLVEKDLVDEARTIMDKAESSGSTLHLPTDFVYAEDVKAQKASGVCAADAIPANSMALDIGPETAAAFNAVLKKAKTIVWNGPMGLFEVPAFAEGSLSLCRTMADLEDALTIVGGGDTDAVVHQAGLADRFSFISTGGGSFLEFLEGKELPGFKALKECVKK